MLLTFGLWYGNSLAISRELFKSKLKCCHFSDSMTGSCTLVIPSYGLCAFVRAAGLSTGAACTQIMGIPHSSVFVQSVCACVESCCLYSHVCISRGFPTSVGDGTVAVSGTAQLVLALPLFVRLQCASHNHHLLVSLACSLLVYVVFPSISYRFEHTIASPIRRATSEQILSAKGFNERKST